MTNEKTQNPALVVVLSLLGILALAMVAGLLLFQKQENPGQGLDITTALSSRDTVPASDDFDPISWAREDADYPPLEQNPEDGDAYTATFDEAGALPDGIEAADEPEVHTQPAAVSPAPKPDIPEPLFNEVRENAWWVQVFSSGNASRAENLRAELSEKGFPANVIVRDVDGQTWYRVRIGAFSEEDEAEHYADELRSLSGFESSYVVQAPVTRRIPADG